MMSAAFDSDDELEGGSALRLDEGQFFAALQDDYCLPAPSHSPESDRLDYLHDVYKYTIGNVPEQVASLLGDSSGPSKRVLDIGCGTGKWAVEIAEAYPYCRVTGVDLVHPPIAQLPSNFDFQLHDVTKGQKFDDGTFDVVHVRDISTGMPDYEAMLFECVRVLKPGGWLLVLEIEWRLSMDSEDGDREFGECFPACQQDAFVDALVERQLDPGIGINLRAHVVNIAGLEDIQNERMELPMSPWHQDEHLAHVGRISQSALYFFGSTIRIMLKDHGEPYPDQLFEAALAELETKGGKPLWSFASVIARKALLPGGSADELGKVDEVEEDDVNDADGDDADERGEGVAEKWRMRDRSEDEEESGNDEYSDQDAPK